MIFFLDNNVPDSVAKVIEKEGYEVIFLRNVMLTDSPDPVVATVCREGGYILVTHNYRDFRKIVNEFTSSNKKTDSLCRVELNCDEVNSASRMAEGFSFIKHEWERLDEKAGLQIFIGKNVYRTHR